MLRSPFRLAALPAVVLAPILALVLVSCASQAEPSAPDSGTQRMAAVLARMNDAMPISNMYESEQRAAELSKVPADETPRERLSRESMLVVELLQAGRIEEAIVLIKGLQERVDTWTGEEQDFMRTAVRQVLALAYLRLGEQENCLINHAPESCILPISGDAVHRLPRGSQLAAAEYTGLLDESNPDDLGWRWLLNLAHMTLGTYPDGVPQRYLIPPSVFAADYDIGRFTNIAPALGLDVNGSAGGAAAEDFDGDGDLDIFATGWRLNEQVRYFVNEGDGTFSDHTEAGGLTGIVGGLNVVHTDYNNDGFADVFVLRGAWYGRDGDQPNSLLRNNGDGTFSDVTFEAGVFSQHPTQAAAWADYNGDGWLDLFIGNETTSNNPHPSELYRNNGDGTFTEVAADVGINIRVYAKGAVWGDIDNDGRPDLFVSTFEGSNRLFHNDGPQDDGSWHFTDVARQAGVAGPERAFPSWFFDYNNDGWEDIFISGYYAEASDVAAEYLGLPHQGAYPSLYRNNGDGTFTDVAAEVGLHRIMLTMGCNFGDVDNDGFLDFYVGTGNPDMRNLMPNRLFRNNGGTSFQEITTSAGVGHLQKGHGVSFADFDQDGALDIYAVIGGAYLGDIYRNVLFHNPGQEQGYLGLRLVGTRSNRAAVGARVRVQVKENGQLRDVYRTVTTGASFGSNPFRLHVGVGHAQSVERVDVLWPSGERQTFEGLTPRSEYRLTEGNPEPERLAVQPIHFQLDAPVAHSH